MKFRKRGRGIDHWSVTPPSGYVEGNALGQKCGLEMARYALGASPHSFADTLTQVALAQIDRGDQSPGAVGAVISFWNTVGTFIHGGVTPDAIAMLMARHENEARAYETALESDRKAASARGRRAALIGAANRKAAKAAAIV